MKNRNWKVVYSSYEGVEKRAVEFVARELGGLILRDPGVYSVHALAVEKAGTPLDRNAVVIGTYSGNDVLRRFLSPADVPAGGYCVRIIDNPDAEGCQLVLVAGDTPAATLWGAIDFIDDGLPAIAPKHDGHTFMADLFEDPPRLAPYESRRAPRSKVRSVFFWGHTVDDLESHFATLARLRFNEVIIWNEYPPVNAADIVACAHSWGISVLWGYSWGWSTDCRKIDFEALDALEDAIVDEWRRVWRPLGGDGIYFQSFTELSQDSINGHPVADMVVSLVNAVCARILAEEPSLRIQFGLHATSVWSRMATIDKTDRRIEIVWENLGGFPYNTCMPTDRARDFAFTQEVLAQDRPAGLVFKCQAMLDWSRNRFNHQPGQYIFGNAGAAALAEDCANLDQIWRRYCHDWLMDGRLAYDIVRLAQSRKGVPVTLNLVGNFVGPIHFPTALVAELFWSADEPYEAILSRVLKRAYIRA